MSRDFQKPIPGQTAMGQLYGLLGASLDALRSQFSGASFPDSPLVGQPCYRTDRGSGVLYVYTGNPEFGEAGWVDYALASLALSNLKHELGEARGSAPSLKARLNVALNDDGTLKGDAPAGDWWTAEADALAMLDETHFSVAGDKRGIYTPRRAIRLEQIQNGYGHVASSVYDEPADLTTVEVAGCAVDAGLSSIEYGQPTDNDPALLAATDAETQAKANATKALTPASLAALGASETFAGLVELATDAETQAGTEGSRAVTPAGLAATIAPVSARGVPSGAISFFACSTAPEGWLACNGQVVSRETYAALFTAIGTQFGAGDGSTTFKLPDLRGEFARGWDNGRGVDSGRTFGSVQADATRSHAHSYAVAVAAYKGGIDNGRSGYATNNQSSTTGATGGAETRPRNVALLACIKA